MIRLIIEVKETENGKEIEVAMTDAQMVNETPFEEIAAAVVSTGLEQVVVGIQSKSINPTNLLKTGLQLRKESRNGRN